MLDGDKNLADCGISEITHLKMIFASSPILDTSKDLNRSRHAIDLSTLPTR